MPSLIGIPQMVIAATATKWSGDNPTPAPGQFVVETNTGKFKIGDGSTPYSALPYFIAGSGGGSANYGVAEVDFGAFPGKSDTSVVITGQASIVAGSKVSAWVVATATTDHSADEHVCETLRITAGSIVAATGFTIYAANDSQLNEPIEPGNRGIGSGTRLYGKFTVHWTWA